MRRIATVAVGIAVVVLAACGDSAPKARLATETTLATDMPSTTVSSDNVASPTMTTRVAAPTTRLLPPTTRPASADRCRNNNGDSSCGQFHWATDPGPNAPLAFDITASPAQPKVGQTVTFTVHVVDPDASPITNCGSSYDDQPTFAAVGCAHTMECAANYGAWDVPAKQRGEATFTYTHAFSSAGEHTAEFHAESMQGSKSAGQCAAQPDPYASVGSGKATLTVAP